VAVTLGPDAMAHVTTQSATKIHQMDANFAVQSQRLELAEGAYLELLPGPTIPHRNSRFVTATQAVVAESATLLCADVLQPGRKYHGAGEVFAFDLYFSTVSIARPDGNPLFTEKVVAQPSRDSVRRVGVMGKFDVVATAYLVTPVHQAEKVL